MAVTRTAAIDVEVVSVGQRDQREPWSGPLDVARTVDGRVELGKPSQSGFESITFDLNELINALDYLGVLDDLRR